MKRYLFLVLGAAALGVLLFGVNWLPFGIGRKLGAGAFGGLFGTGGGSGQVGQSAAGRVPGDASGSSTGGKL